MLHAVSAPTHRGRATGTDEVADAVLGASRALVAVAARSLATVAEDVTLAQYRALIELAARGPLRLREAGMIKSSPDRIIAEGADWRFLREVRRELG